MISLELRGQKAFMDAIDKAIVDIPQEVAEKFHAWTLVVFRDLVRGTPQWSGDTAANWNYSVGMPNYSYHPIVRKALSWSDVPGGQHLEPLQRGDLAAVNAAIGRAEDGPEPRYDQKVYFTNAAPIASRLENDPSSVPVRPVNLIDGAVQMVSYTATKWRNIPFRVL